MQIEANGIRIEVEDSGGDGPVVMLLMGLGGQLIHWPAAFVQALVDAGWRVLRLDNRDAGLSSHFSAPNTSRTTTTSTPRSPAPPPSSSAAASALARW